MNLLYKEIFDYLYSNLKTSQLYSIGGTSRDYLLNNKIDDFDFTSNLTPNEVKSIFKDGNYTFSKYGTVDLTYKGKRITLTTFRKDITYLDKRHPQVEFISSYKEDSLRRDFTINSIYIDYSNLIYDPQNGVNDLNNRLIRMIGNISTRINEDPLRILRCYRFKSQLDFNIDNQLEEYIDLNFDLLKNISKGKIIQELNKCKIDMKLYLFKRLVDDKILEEGCKHELNI